jgi:hypothetical protein
MAALMRCVSVYVVCPDDQAQPVAEKMQNIMIGYALEVCIPREATADACTRGVNAAADTAADP